MPEYNNEMRIALFPNDKGGNDKRPDYRGTLQIAGIAYKVSLWNRTGRNGAFLSGSVERDTKQQQTAKPEPKITKDDVPPGQYGDVGF